MAASSDNCLKMFFKGGFTSINDKLKIKTVGIWITNYYLSDIQMLVRYSNGILMMDHYEIRQFLINQIPNSSSFHILTVQRKNWRHQQNYLSVTLSTLFT